MIINVEMHNNEPLSFYSISHSFSWNLLQIPVWRLTFVDGPYTAIGLFILLYLTYGLLIWGLVPLFSSNLSYAFLPISAHRYILNQITSLRLSTICRVYLGLWLPGLAHIGQCRYRSPICQGQFSSRERLQTSRERGGAHTILLGSLPTWVWTARPHYAPRGRCNGDLLLYSSLLHPVSAPGWVVSLLGQLCFAEL